MPLNNLGIGIVVAIALTEGVRIDEGTHRITTKVTPVRVQLPSVVTSLNIDQRLVDKANDLDVVRRPHVLNTLKSAGWNDAGTLARLRAPCDFLTFSVGDQGVGLGRGPKTKI